MWRALPSDTSHHAQKVIPIIGGGALGENLCLVCRQDCQTLSLEYTFLAKNIPLNIKKLLKITRPYTVSGENTPFLNIHNARDSLIVLTNNLLFPQHTHLGVMFETQSCL